MVVFLADPHMGRRGSLACRRRGKLREPFGKAAGAVRESCGSYAEKLRKSCGKAAEKLRELCGKAAEKLRKSCGKAAEQRIAPLWFALGQAGYRGASSEA